MKEAEMKQIAGLIAAVIHDSESAEVSERVKREVAELTARFPMYPNRYKEAKIESISAS
jgi:glycine/serine hydroxymethyltransferase